MTNFGGKQIRASALQHQYKGDPTYTIQNRGRFGGEVVFSYTQADYLVAQTTEIDITQLSAPICFVWLWGVVDEKGGLADGFNSSNFARYAQFTDVNIHKVTSDFSWDKSTLTITNTPREISFTGTHYAYYQYIVFYDRIGDLQLGL
ncbi:hypothetical protein [Caudoviricetes sp.]|nr:hypothetical protein [Caudoviricetes sp.]